MSLRSTQPYFDEHAALRDQVEHLPVIARELSSIEPDERFEVIERVAAFLAEILLPHCAAEERVLYPEAARLLGEEDGSDAVAADREQVRELLGNLAMVDVRDVGETQEILFALNALLQSHLWREEELYLKLAASSDQKRANDLLERAGRRFRPSPPESPRIAATP
jgi:iron-sulfur cluster repair protein YtfE (RIC family)